MTSCSQYVHEMRESYNIAHALHCSCSHKQLLRFPLIVFTVPRYSTLCFKKIRKWGHGRLGMSACAWAESERGGQPLSPSTNQDSKGWRAGQSTQQFWRTMQATNVCWRQVLQGLSQLQRIKAHVKHRSASSYMLLHEAAHSLMHASSCADAPRQGLSGLPDIGACLILPGCQQKIMDAIKRSPEHQADLPLAVPILWWLQHLLDA